MRRKIMSYEDARAQQEKQGCRFGHGMLQVGRKLDVQPIDADEDYFSPVDKKALFTMEEIWDSGLDLEFDQDEWPTYGILRRLK